VQASLGLIPRSALVLEVQVEGNDVPLRFQLAELTEEDVVDMDDIVWGSWRLWSETESVSIELMRSVAGALISPTTGCAGSTWLGSR
jgi:hypothetical protein